VLSLHELAPGGPLQLDILAPVVAAKARAGQLVILQARLESARISLPIAEIDPEEGRLGLVFAANGALSLSELRAGERLEALLGPVGQPTPVERLGVVILVGMGLEAFSLAAIGEAHQKAGNRVIALASGEPGLLGALVEKLSAACSEAKTAPDGLSLLGLLGETLRAEGEVALTVAAGPIPLLRAVRELTHGRGVPTRLRLNPHLLDGEGLCGGCRVKVGGSLRLCCLEGVEFEAAGVDLDYVGSRQGACHI
jgi:ferredoxin--NADP+ reductase